MRSKSKDDDREACIRIGSSYQVEIFPEIANENVNDININNEVNNVGECIWDPEILHEKIEANQCEEFIKNASELGWPEYEALGILYLCQGNVEKSSTFLEQLEPDVPSENWTVDDNATFQSAFSVFGKDFGLINKWLPHKTTRELVDFYYWLKSKNQIKSPKVQTSTLNTQNTDSMIRRCKTNPHYSDDVPDISTLTKNIERTMCEITAETSYNDSCETEAKISEKLHSEIQARKRDVFAMKFENNKNFDHIAKIGNDEKKRSSLLYRWEDQEIYYFSLGIKDFGKDYVKIAKIIQTKSATQLEKFYNDNHEKFLLSLSYEEFMNKNNPVPTEPSAEIEEVTGEPENEGEETSGAAAPVDETSVSQSPVDMPCEVEILDD